MGFKFALVTAAGDVLESFTTNEGNWETGDTVIAHGNRHYQGLERDVGPLSTRGPSNWPCNRTLFA